VTAAARAVWFTAPRHAEVRDAEVSSPGRDEVTVAAVASLISLGSEMRIYRGEVPADQEVRPVTVEGSFAFPIKYGYQVVGRVVEAGEDSAFSGGELVFCRHPHQSRFTIRVGHADPPLITRLPEFKPPEMAVFSNLLDVALNAILDVSIRVGDVVAVFGYGTVGCFCAQLAQLTASRVVVVEVNPLRRQLALELGADAAVAPEDAREAVMSASRGRGTDVSIEASGSPPALQEAIRCTGMEGTVLVPAWYGDRTVPLVLSPEFHLGRQRIVSSMTRAMNPELRSRWDLARRLEVAWELLPRFYNPKMVSHHVSLEDAPSAYRMADEDPSSVLGIVIEYPISNGSKE
jgi:2-desacetyl-2-hydroxyethyl bacteriochlorophyllide A dehydrogenase